MQTGWFGMKEHMDPSLFRQRLEKPNKRTERRLQRDDKNLSRALLVVGSLAAGLQQLVVLGALLGSLGASVLLGLELICFVC